jgi:hypothetical protein
VQPPGPTGNCVEIIDAGLFVRSNLTLDIDEMLAGVRETPDRVSHVQPGQNRFELPRDHHGIADRIGIREGLACRLRNRQRLTVAVDDHRALARRDDVGNRLQWPFGDRRHRLLREIRANGVDDCHPSDPDAHNTEHKRKQAGGKNQPAAASLHRVATPLFSCGDMKMLHPQNGVLRRRAAAHPEPTETGDWASSAN